MKTDKLFYRLFQSLPDLFFTLTGLDYSSDSYEFKSIEIKELKFTIDGVFIPKEKDLPIIFTEIQFQKDKDFYSRLFTEIFIYLRQYKPENPWRAVVIFPNKGVDVGNMFHYQELEPRLTRIYLRESLPKTTTDTSLQLLKMIIIKDEQKVIDIARELVETDQDEEQQDLLYGFIETIILYRHPKLTREEVEAMIHFPKVNIEQTPLYQEALIKGENKKALQMVLTLSKYRFDNLGETQENQIKTLSEQQLDILATALFDFKSSDDLTHWLNSNTKLLN
ncbi:MAG: DUF2887 domain-containing protein [Methylococcaceae bacterium]|nr:DUF2887 domain-containing protein [Methylococcaceae bacterium]